ncbi:LicD family-domain-containing protein [Scheffersomyces coipomensis]|uniref:LicD family-domain-containing protein n=1 Tax=Scheffersomyces coipomensis TaxID=1788519 RepID=UPI00315DD97E
MIEKVRYHRLIRYAFAFALIINVLYFIRVYSVQETRLRIKALIHSSSINYKTDDQVSYPDNVDYNKLSSPLQKISYLLNNISKTIDNNDINDSNHPYWLADTLHTHHEVIIDPNHFLPPTENHPTTWVNSPQLFYDPRFTLSLYLESLRSQISIKNPQNLKSNDNLVQLPFSWSDWVDLTMLNSELAKPYDERLDCTWLQSKINKPTKYPHFCQNLMDASDEEISKLPLPKEMLPGFLVKTSPMNKAPHEQVMMQGKAHLLVFQHNPLNIIFLSKSGTYEAQILPDSKRIHHTDMLKEYLKRKKIDFNNIENINQIHLNPLDEFNSLINNIPPRPLDSNDDIYGMRKYIKDESSSNSSREIFLNHESFNYKQEQIDQQIDEYEDRLEKLQLSYTNELKFDHQILKENSLTRHELNHYQGLKYANSIPNDEEPTYYKLSTLLKNKNNQDAGWHYEWRFFNGALRYIKDESWTANQLEIREQIILDRLLRNWFKFAAEKAIISWIAHGPLLSWYWDGLMFPFDVDIDIQMPTSELNRLSKNYNQTLVIEDVNEGFGKFFIDCSSFIHHRDQAVKDNHIDARFIDIDTGTYIDITGIGKNNEIPPPEYDSYIRHKNLKGESVELYMDRRKHWSTFEKINPLRYSMIGGVPVYVPNDIMAMLNHEYSHGTTAFHYQGYYYVPILRLWIHEKYLLPLFSKKTKQEVILDKKGKVKVQEFSKLIRRLKLKDKLKLLERNDQILIEYYLTHKLTNFHEIEKQLMLDYSLRYSLQDFTNNKAYHDLTSKFKMGKPLRKSLYDFEYFDRFKHKELLSTKYKAEHVDEDIDVIHVSPPPPQAQPAEPESVEEVDSQKQAQPIEETQQQSEGEESDGEPQEELGESDKVKLAGIIEAMP